MSSQILQLDQVTPVQLIDFSLWQKLIEANSDHFRLVGLRLSDSQRDEFDWRREQVSIAALDALRLDYFGLDDN